jgi:ABC-type transport system involved in multi-copper enzyme maturation permease subunit
VKYLAILKDSVREAIDTKVFYVMLAVSCVLILLVGSLSFAPRPASELADEYTTLPLNAERSQLSKFAAGLGLPFVRSSKVWIQDKIEPADGAPDSPESPLHFRIHARFAKKEEAAKIRQAPAATEDFIKERFATFEDWKVFEVTRVELAPSTEANLVAFDVYTQPTKVTRRIWPCEPNLFFGAVPLPVFKTVALGVQLYVIEGTLVNGLGAWVAILVSVVITSFFIPNMLRKGTLDLLVVKPIHRTTLLIYKYVGGLTFILLNTTFAVGGVWLMLGLRSGIWSPGFLLTIFIITFFFAILYSVSALFGVLIGSPIVSILTTCLAWFVFWAAGQLYLVPDALRQMQEIQEVQERQRPQSETKKDGPEQKSPEDRVDTAWWVSAVKAIHFVLPRTSDLNYLTNQLLVRDVFQAKQIEPQQLTTARFSWTESLTVNGAFVALMLGLACLRFATKDY